jgi:hypothetical protein
MRDNEKLLAYSTVNEVLDEARERINIFCQRVLRTRGGRIGSGMGGLLEALWGYEVNSVLKDRGNEYCELAWFPDHQYHDFACVKVSQDWNPKTGEGEFFKVEAKSMNSGADESKAHFDVLESELDELDALVLLIWSWLKTDEYHSSPQITDCLFVPAKPITRLRDRLHIARGGSFVDRNNCPDKCKPEECKHHGEPLNEQLKRERLSGPETCRPSAKVSYAANFGGLIRMLKTRGSDAKTAFREIRRGDEVVDKFVSFVHKHYPSEEKNHYSTSEWKQIANHIGITQKNISVEEIQLILRQRSDYQIIVRSIF